MRLHLRTDLSLESYSHASAILNRWYWNLSTEEVDGRVVLFGGEVAIAEFDSFEELSIFAAGMALALAVLPEEIAAHLDELV